jgi:hypothetical protein
LNREQETHVSLSVEGDLDVSISVEPRDLNMTQRQPSQL